MILTAFLSGLSEAFSPFGITQFLFFLIFLNIVATSKPKIMIYGGFFIVILFLSTFFVIFGIYDRYLEDKYVFDVVLNIYFYIGLVFILSGVFNLTGWVRCHTGKGLDRVNCMLPNYLKPPRISSHSSWKKIFGIIVLVFVIILTSYLAFFTTLMRSFWVQDDYSFILYSYFMSGAVKDSITLILVYIMGLCIPFLAVWLTVMRLGELIRDEKSRPVIVRYYYLISAAFLLSAGVGLIHIYLTL